MKFLLVGVIQYLFALASYPLWFRDRRISFKRWALGMLFAIVIAVPIAIALNSWFSRW